MRRTSSLALLALLLCSGCGEIAAIALARRAVNLAEQGDLEGAVVLLDDAVRLAPDSALVRVTRGTALRKLGDYPRAIEDFDKAIELDPSDAAAWWQRAFAWQQSGVAGWEDKAFADASRAIELDPDTALAYILRGNVHAAKDRLDLAIADFDEAIRINPDSCSAYGNRAFAYASLGDLNRARADLDRSLSLHPTAEDRKIFEAFRDSLEERPANPAHDAARAD